MQNADNERDIFSLEAAARRMDMTAEDLEHLIDTGELKAARTPGGYRVTRRDIDAYLKQAGSSGLFDGARLPAAVAALAAVLMVSGLGIWKAGAFSNAPSPEGIPLVIPYQGTLAENNKPVSGQRSMEFALFDAPKSKKPTKLWATKKPVSIDVVDGKFTVNLGTHRKSNPLSKDIFAEKQLFLRITVDGTHLQPWQQVAPAPQAVHAANGVPPGTIAPFAGSPSDVPAGWLACTGKAYEKSKYPELYAAIGTNWGDGRDNCSGNCDFNLPDLRGRFVRGMSMGSGRDPDRNRRGRSKRGGNKDDNVGSIQNWATGFPRNNWNIKSNGRHRHRVRDAYWIQSTCGGNGNKLGANGQDRSNDYCERWVNSEYSGNHSHGISGGDRETRPENAYILYIIKY